MSQNTTGWRSVLSISRIYQLCQNFLGSAKSRNEFVENYIRPKHGMRILDLGCGPADILDVLSGDTHYVGIDLSRDYIESARKKYGPRGEFHCLPVETLSEEGIVGFDLVMGLGVIHHLNDKQAVRFFSIATRILNESGRCLTIDPCLVKGQHVIARTLIRMDRGENIRSAENYATLARCSFRRIEQQIHHNMLCVPYTHHIMECWN